ncbi:MAG: aspartate--tRNA ligase [Deltaproteobacteria bacterium]|nr:MAG: aspartate--tRNA ligase [Deltaproteobacteria bacterium]
MEIDTIGDWKRTNDCGSLRRDDIDREVVLMGWVNSRRDLGKLIFIDLRDRFGLTQIIFDEAIDKVSHEKAGILRNEWVIGVKGKVTPRLAGQENSDMPTGDIEVKVKELKVLNETNIPPFQVDGKIDASENLRLKYRYLELRRPALFHNLVMRHRIALCIRNFLAREGFLEVETPFLTKSTPEGARDYLVPSRISKGSFYALPQSPQLFKQLLMMAGFDRYFQIVRCFRDEDLRADRQPEFTQVDLELSFADEFRVMDVIEGMMADVFPKILDHPVSTPFPIIEYKKALDLYGSDRPDIRFGMELMDLSDLLRSSGFRVFKEMIEEGGVVKAINVEKGASFSRKELDELNSIVTDSGARGLFWAKVKSDGWQSTLAKFLAPDIRSAVEQRLGAKEGDLILFVPDKSQTTNEALGLLRTEISKRLGLVKGETYSFVWVTRFPLLEYNRDEKRYVAVHHPFTSPLEEDMPLLMKRPEAARARSYDLVLNGTEIGGGSVRIHTIELQNQIFRILGLGKEEVKEKFGFFLEALSYGAPPHAGIALGFDRLVAIMAGAKSLRDVIAFPKTQRATCAVTEAPSKVNNDQLAELGISLIYP